MKIKKHPLRTWTYDQLIRALHVDMEEIGRLAEYLRDSQESVHCLIAELARRGKSKRSRIGKGKG